MHCAGCLHHDRDALDAQLVQGVPYRSIATTFNLSLGSISRHKHHVKEMIQGRTPAEMNEHGSALRDRVVRLVDEAEQILATAKAREDFRGANGALGAACKLLDLCARLSGELQVPNSGGIHLTKITNVNVTHSDDKELAVLVQEATDNWNPAVVEHLKALAGCNDDAPRLISHSIQRAET